MASISGEREAAEEGSCGADECPSRTRGILQGFQNGGRPSVQTADSALTLCALSVQYSRYLTSK